MVDATVLNFGKSGNQADEHAPEEMMAMLPIWSICTTLGLRGGDFTSNAQAFENKGARISFHPSPARQAGRQAGRQADNHNHLYVYTASGDDDIQPLSVL